MVSDAAVRTALVARRVPQFHLTGDRLSCLHRALGVFHLEAANEDRLLQSQSSDLQVDAFPARRISPMP